MTASACWTTCSSQLGAPEEPPRTQVGGRQDEEEGALLLVEWRFPADGRPAMLRRLEEIMGQSLEKQVSNQRLADGQMKVAPRIGKEQPRQRYLSCASRLGVR